MHRIRVTVDIDIVGYSGDEARKHALHFATFALNQTRPPLFSRTVDNIKVVDGAVRPTDAGGRHV